MSKHKSTRRQFGLVCASFAMLNPGLYASASAQAKTPAVQTAGSLPGELSAFGQSNTWQMQGTGALRFFGFKAYDANLWTTSASRSNPLADKNLFALEIVYKTSIKAEEIVNVSLIEMARLKKLTDVQIKSWTTEMQRTFPNVTSGDRLTGVYVPKQGTRFFFNSRLIAEINDPAFGDAFFAIWLDEGTKRADLRRALLGLPPPTAATANN